MIEGASDDDDNCDNKSVDSAANRKRKLNIILGSNKRMHVERATKSDNDSDSTHDNTDRATSLNDNDDGASSRMSDFDDGTSICITVF